MASDTIHLQSIFKGLKVCVDGGAMDYNAGGGRQPRVSKQPTNIAFKGGMATVERSSPRVPSNPWKTCDFADLGAKTRAEAVDAIRRLNGHGSDFTIVDATVEADVRAPAAAAR